jgi:hypothetical protein
MDETALHCLETGGDPNLAGAAKTQPAPSKSTDDIHLTCNDMLETVPESSTSIQSENASRQTLLPLYQASLLVEKMNCSYFFDERSLIGLSDEQGKNTVYRILCLTYDSRVVSIGLQVEMVLTC